MGARRPRFHTSFATTVGIIALGATSLASPAAAAAPTAACTAAPRPAAEFVFPDDPAADGGRSRQIIEDAAQTPAGTPAGAADIADAQAFAELYTACQNAGDMRRTAALYSDAMFRDDLAARVYLLVDPSNPLEALYHLLFDPNGRLMALAAEELAYDVAIPPSPLSEPIATAEVRDVRVLADGRLGAILVQDGRPTEFQIYVRVSGQLLLDESMSIL